jgi:chlorite dismutase
MQLIGPEKEPADPANLRLVQDLRGPSRFPQIDRQFVNFIFFRVHHEWRKLDADVKAAYRAEFESVFAAYSGDLLVFKYSLVGFDSKADLMFWRIGPSLDALQEMTAKLYRTGLGSFLETTDNYLSITKKMMFLAPGVCPSTEDRYHIKAGEKKYHFVYPCAKHRDWYANGDDERTNVIEENFMVGRKFENIKIHLTHAFGFSEQEFIISFETDEPKDFLALAEELRQTKASRFTLRGMPIYTCRQRSLSECLEALG